MNGVFTGHPNVEGRCAIFSHRFCRSLSGQRTLEIPLPVLVCELLRGKPVIEYTVQDQSLKTLQPSRMLLYSF